MREGAVQGSAAPATMSAPIAAWGASIALTGCGLGYVCGHSAATGHPTGPRLASRLLALCHVLLSATCVLAWHGGEEERRKRHAATPAAEAGPSAPAFNCSPAPRVGTGPVVWVAERPGRERQGPASEGDLDRWVEHLRCRGVGRVLCLLGEKHLRLYAGLRGGSLQRAVRDRGLGWGGVPFHRGTPLLTHLRAAAEQLREAESRGESVVIHCSAGCGRSVRSPRRPNPTRIVSS